MAVQLSPKPRVATATTTTTTTTTTAPTTTTPSTATASTTPADPVTATAPGLPPAALPGADPTTVARGFGQGLRAGANVGFIDPKALAAKLESAKEAAKLPGLMGARLGKTFVAHDLQGKPVEVVIQKYLAHGHFGDVYLAQNSRGERFAAKFLREVRQVEDWKGKPWDTAEESKNLRAAAATGDPRLVGGLGSGTLQGSNEPGVLIAWAGDGVKTLSETWSDPQAQRLPGKAARIAREVLHALSSLHGAGLEHGDIGPTNVMIGADDATSSVRLIDPGNARGVTDDKVKADLRGVARLFTALLEGKGFDRDQTTAPSLDGIDAHGLSATDADEFRARARGVLQKAFDGGYGKAWDMWSDVHDTLADTRFG